MNRRPALFLAAILCSTVGQAAAGSSPWQSFNGADLRAVVAAVPMEDGKLRAALEIALKPGWKTYWLDPGGSGVPPSVEASVDGLPVETTISMPAPKRVSDGYSTFAGYDAPMALALTIAPAPAGKVELSVFLGICETICIPVQASFEINPAAAAPEDTAAVETAFAALPAEPRPGFGVTSSWTSGDELTVEVALPGDAGDAQLFVASSASFPLGEPRLGADGRFRVPLLDRPADPTVVEQARYTLVADGEAVSGTLTIAGHP